MTINGLHFFGENDEFITADVSGDGTHALLVFSIEGKREDTEIWASLDDDSELFSMATLLADRLSEKNGFTEFNAYFHELVKLRPKD